MTKHVIFLTILSLLIPLAACVTVNINLPQGAQIEVTDPGGGNAVSIDARSTEPPDVKPPSFNNFKASRRAHSEKDDLEELIMTEFGPDYRVADWDDIRRYADVIEEWAKEVGLPKGENKSFLISQNGSRFWQGRRHYYVSRFDHDKPGHYLAHDNLKDDYLCLGSWYDLQMRVLAIKKSAGAKH